MTRSLSLAMRRYSVQLRERIFVKGYGFLFSVRNMSKNVHKKMNKNLSSKYSQKRLDHANKSATDTLKSASKKVIQKTEKASSDLIGNKIADKITRASKTSPKNNLETNEEEMLRERYISPELRQKFINDLRLKEENF